jgi:hypothetical protein
MKIIMLHPKATPAHLGFIPSFLFENDPRPAKQQFNERYVSGWRPAPPNCKLDARNRLLYPGDPPLKPYAIIEFRDETILIYEGDWVCILQPDGSFEACRMD